VSASFLGVIQSSASVQPPTPSHLHITDSHFNRFTFHQLHIVTITYQLQKSPKHISFTCHIHITVSYSLPYQQLHIIILIHLTVSHVPSLYFIFFYYFLYNFYFVILYVYCCVYIVCKLIQPIGCHTNKIISTHISEASHINLAYQL